MLKTQFNARIVVFATCAGFSVPSVYGQLISDDFESYTVDTSLDSSGPWDTVQLGSNSVIVRDENTDTPFGTPNQYLDYNDNTTSSIRIQTSDRTELSGVVTTLAFDFEEPATGGGDQFLFGYSVTGGDLTSAGARVMPRLDNEVIVGLSSTAANTYSFDTPYRLYMVFNDSDSEINYLGGPLAAGVADIWIQPAGGGALTFVGTRSGQNTQTASYRIGFRGYGSNLQQMLVDDVTVHEGIAVPGATPNLVSTIPADDDGSAAASTDLVANFDMPVSAGTGNITITGGASPIVLDVATASEVSFAGSTLTIDLTSDLDLSTNYSVQIDGTAIVNALGEAYTGISNTTDWNFTTSADATPPVILSRSPADDASAVALGSNLVLTFDEPIAEGIGNITITNLTESSTFATIDITDVSQVGISGSTLTINPAADLREGRSYAIEIDAGSVTDTTGNPFAGISGTTDWNFATIPDTTNPTLVFTSAADDAEGVAFSSNLVATFDEPVQAGTGNITILNLTTATTFATIAVTDGSQVTFSGDTMTIDPASNLDPGQYAIQIDAGAVTDLSTNPWAGIVSPDETSWNFTTYLLTSTDYIEGEREDLGALDYYTNSGSTQVGTGGGGGSRIDRLVVLGFTLPVLPVGQTAGSVDFSFEITEAFDNTGAAGANLPDLHAYLLNTANPDSSGTSFYYHGPADPNPNVELAGTTAPSAPLNSGSSVSFPDDTEDRTFTLSGDALALFQSFYGGDNIPDQPEAFFRFNLSEDPDITSYRRYRIDLADDESGIEITPVIATAPALAATLPADDATAVSQGSNLVATFDQPIRAGSGNITIKNVTDSTTFATIPVGDAQVSISGTVMKVDPSTDLDPNKEYAIQLDAGVIEDLTGQGSAAITDDTTWSFTTGFSGVQASVDSIRGRAQSASLDYFVDSSAGGRVGIGGPSGDRQDFNIVLGFTLPTLPIGETISGASFDFEIVQSNDGGSDPALHLYVLDTADPDTSGVTFFYQGASDPNTDVEFVGSTNLPATGNVSYADDEQDQTLTITGDALALLESYYGGDHIPEQTEVFFRFNLDQELGGATLNNFERYFIDTDSAESSLTIASTNTGGGSAYDTWAGGFSPNPGLSTDNPDSDPLNNLLEFAFGTNPNVSDAVPLVADGSVNGVPIVQSSGSGEGITFEFLFVRRIDFGTSGSVTYTPEFSNDLGVWHQSTATPASVAGPTDGYEVVSVPYPAILPGGLKARFARLRVDEVP